MSALMVVVAVVRLFAYFFCFFFSYSYCMEEREQKGNISSRKSLEMLRKCLLVNKKELQKSGSAIVKERPTISQRRLEKFRHIMHSYSKIKKLPLCVPSFPYYFTSVKEVENFINDLKSWGLTINYQFPENGRTLAHYAFDLDELHLFERSHHENEIVESEAKGNKETDIQFHALIPEEYLALQYQLIDKLLMCKDIDFTICDNNGETPFECFVRSVVSSKTKKSDERIKAELIYIPKIFDAIIRHGYIEQIKQEINCNYENDYNIDSIRQRLCLFPIYESLTETKAFIREKLSDLKDGINTTDLLEMTILHRIFRFLKGARPVDKGTKLNLHYIAHLFGYICEFYEPDFSIKNNYEETPIDCFFSLLLALKPEGNELPINDNFDISARRTLTTMNKKSIEDTYAIFKQITISCPYEILRNSFINFPAKEQLIITSFISAFPIFINISDVKQILTKRTKIVETIDLEGNSYLHCAVDFSKKYILKSNILKNRLLLIQLLLENTKGDLVSKKNKYNNIPFFIFIVSIPIKNVNKESNKKKVKAILLKLVAQSSTRERISMINQCSKERLIFLKKILLGSCKPREKELVTELLRLINFSIQPYVTKEG